MPEFCSGYFQGARRVAERHEVIALSLFTEDAVRHNLKFFALCNGIASRTDFGEIQLKWLEMRIVEHRLYEPFCEIFTIVECVALARKSALRLVIVTPA